MTYFVALLLAFFAVILNIIAQAFLKQTASKRTIEALDFASLYDFLYQSIFSLTFIVGVFSAFLASLLYLISLSKLPLSVAFPFTGLSFIAIFLIGIFMFNEKLSFLNVSGMVLMLIGIFLITYSSA